MEELLVPRDRHFVSDFIESVSLSPSFDLFLCQTQSSTFELAKRVLCCTSAEVRHAGRNNFLVGTPTAAILDVLGSVIHGTRLS